MAFFSAPAASSSSSFSQNPSAGAATAIPSAFGSGQPQQQQPQQPQQNNPSTGLGGFSFGSSAATSQPAVPSQQQPAGTGGLLSFGASTATSQPQQQQPASTAPSGSLFGNFGGSVNTQPTTTTTGGLGGGLGGGFSFGSSSTNQQQPQQQQLLQPQPQPQQQQQQQLQLQQPQQQQQLGSSLFGASTTTSNPLAQSQQQPPTFSQPDKKLGYSLALNLEQIRAAWGTNNAARCRFVYYFYNNAGNLQNLKIIQGRRPDAIGPMHDQLWAAAVRDNPDPDRLYPVLALGFNDLKKRVTSQDAETQRQRQLLSSLAQRLASLQQKHSLNNTVRCQAATTRQSQLHHRLVGLIAKCQVLIPALRGKSIGPDEERLFAILESCQAEITGSLASATASAATAAALGRSRNGNASSWTTTSSSTLPSRGPSLPPTITTTTTAAATPSASNVLLSSHARLRAKVNELWAQLGVVRAKREMPAREGRVSATEWAVVDESGIENVTKILASQQQGLHHLSTTITNDTKTMDTITQGLSGVKLVGVSSR